MAGGISSRSCAVTWPSAAASSWALLGQRARSGRWPCLDLALQRLRDVAQAAERLGRAAHSARRRSSPICANCASSSPSCRARLPSRVRLALSWVASRPASISIFWPARSSRSARPRVVSAPACSKRGPALLDHRQHALALRLEARARLIDRFGRPLHRAVDRRVHLRRRLVHPLRRRAGAAFDPGDMGAEPLRRAADRLVRLAALARPARRAGFPAPPPARARRGPPASSPRPTARACSSALGRSLISTPISTRAVAAALSSACALRSSSAVSRRDRMGHPAEPVRRFVAEAHQPRRFLAQRRAILRRAAPPSLAERRLERRALAPASPSPPR